MRIFLFLIIILISCTVLKGNEEKKYIDTKKTNNNVLEDFSNPDKSESCKEILVSADLVTRCDVFITLKFKNWKNMKPIITGLTNLPDDTMLKTLFVELRRVRLDDMIKKPLYLSR